MKNTRLNLRAHRQLPQEMQMARVRAVLYLELTPLQREALMAYYFEGKTMEQIGKERGVNKSTICRTLHRAEKKLRRYLQY